MRDVKGNLTELIKGRNDKDKMYDALEFMSDVFVARTEKLLSWIVPIK